MTSSVTASAGINHRATEFKTIGLVSSAHFVSHFQQLVLPVLFPFLKAKLGIDFIELGLALTVSNVMSVAAQLPMGALCDRLGSRRVLIAGLLLGGCAFVALGVAPSYPALLVVAGFWGISNSVYHPADYAILSARMAPARVGRAFSIHTFCGFLGNAVAPIVVVGLATLAGVGAALIATGILGLFVSIPLILSPNLEDDAMVARAAASAAQHEPRPRVFTPLIIGLTGFFALLSLSGSGLTNFSVVALGSAYGTPVSLASLALTVYLMAQAFGVLLGGLVADLTKRHGEVAAIGYAVNALIVLAIATLGLGTVPLVLAMGGAGLLGGLIMPSRDMLVRAAAPPGAVGRTFGIVTTGFNIGGAVGPMLFGWIMDRGAPHWVFGASVIFMVITAATAMIGDRRTGHARPAPAAAE
ncbi:MAG TPA: MFS transporter [Stellaceae bacterium]|nr:MFS transporter [Stellaceae bacterium]